MAKLALNQVHHGDVLDLIQNLEENSVALSVWSPPYYVGKKYEKYLNYEAWKNLLKETIRHHYRILKPGGFLVINIADILCFPDDSIPKFQSLNKRLQKVKLTREDVLKAKEENPTFNRRQLAELLGCSEQTVDRRLNGNNIRGGKHQPMTRVHLVGGMLESMAYDANLYLYDRRIWKKDPAWKNSKWVKSTYKAVDEFEHLFFFWKAGEMEVKRERLSDEEWKTWGARAVWEFPSVRSNRDHEAKFPMELPLRVIKLLTDKHDLVLDCFMGSGTTAQAAIKMERNFVGFELHDEYVELSNLKIKESLELRKQLQLL